jgi:hypothetical protein
VIDATTVAAAPIEAIVSPNIVQASPDYSGQRAKCLLVTQFLVAKTTPGHPCCARLRGPNCREKSRPVPKSGTEREADLT